MPSISQVKLNGIVYDIQDETSGFSKAKSITAILETSKWKSNKQTIEIDGLETEGCTYIVSPSPSSIRAYGESGIYAEDVVTENSMTFVCEEEPNTNINVYITKVQVE